MKCYKKEDLKKIGYYRTEEQLQERLKEIECEAICVGEEKLSATCKRIKKEFPSMCLGVQLFFTNGNLVDERIVLMKKVEITDGHSVKAPKDFISKGEYIVWRHDSSKEFNYEYFNYMTSEVFNEAYITESDVKDFVHKCALKVEKLFHVTKKNIKVISTYDGFYNGVAEDVVLPDWLKRRIQDCSVVVKRKKFGQSMTQLRIFEENYLLFTDTTNGRSVKINFGDYVALLGDGSLKVFSEELVDKFHLGK